MKYLSLITLLSLTLVLPAKANAFALKGSHNDTGINLSPPVPPASISQTFIASHDQLSAIHLMMGSASGPASGEVTLNLIDNRNGLAITSASLFIDKLTKPYFHIFKFNPIINSKNQSYRFVINFESDTAEDKIHTLTSNYNSYQDGQLTIDNLLINSDLVFRSYYDTDKKFIDLAKSSLANRFKADGAFSSAYILLITLTSLFVLRQLKS